MYYKYLKLWHKRLYRNKSRYVDMRKKVESVDMRRIQQEWEEVGSNIDRVPKEPREKSIP